MHHELKCVNPYFEEVWQGRKTFEVRLSSDGRTFIQGDVCTLREFDPISCQYSNRKVYCTITYVLRDFVGLHPDYVVFSFSVISRSSVGSC